MYDKKFIADLYDSHAAELIVYIYTFLKSQEASEDVLHDVFVKLIKYSDKSELYKRSPRALLYSIAKNLSIDYLRKNKRMVETHVEEIFAAGSTVHEEMEKKEIRSMVEAALRHMKTRTRSVYILRSELEMRFADIADTLKISERTAKREMQRALMFIADELEKTGFIKL